MAVVGNRRADCEGCGRTVSPEESTTVTMPNGDEVVCCPDCEPHARAAVRTGTAFDQRRATCDGCTGRYLATELEDVVLDDGTALTCCPSCLAQAPDPDGDDDGSDPDGGGATGSRTASHTSTSVPDTDHDRCRQCHERVAEERFRVTTIDGRTERLCSDCTADAEERGIVADVAMRTTRAREVLGVDADASDEAIREAFHRQVKRAHPDRQSGSQSAFTLVTDAYERLREED
ncbi:J domain-containing protein [Natrinema ejinorense]|uniref:Molecular chaperone DnaJ n=1 Tax=Natrinema ejinorense TaxID=373386 RepID=A0A2A5QU23_9EURY|nr:J domain-containing protein [Natrinema ejinorense]PCR90348.1 molecular chaperone DnaJ [Natrinema ejinorense]